MRYVLFEAIDGVRLVNIERVVEVRLANETSEGTPTVALYLTSGQVVRVLETMEGVHGLLNAHARAGVGPLVGK